MRRCASFAPLHQKMLIYVFNFMISFAHLSERECSRFGTNVSLLLGQTGPKLLMNNSLVPPLSSCLSVLLSLLLTTLTALRCGEQCSDMRLAKLVLFLF